MIAFVPMFWNLEPNEFAQIFKYLGKEGITYKTIAPDYNLEAMMAGLWSELVIIPARAPWLVTAFKNLNSLRSQSGLVEAQVYVINGNPDEEPIPLSDFNL